MPYALILVVLSLLGWADTNQITLYMSRYFPLFAFTVLGGTTLLLFFVGITRMRGSTGGGKKNEDKVDQT